MKEVYCIKCQMKHPMQVVTVVKLKSSFIVEYRCRLTAFHTIKREDENPLYKKPS